METTSRDRDDLIIQANDIHGSRAIQCSSISELAVSVMSPAFDTTNVSQSARVPHTSIESNHTRVQAYHIQRNIARIVVSFFVAIAGRPISELAEFVISPTFDAVIRHQCTIMPVSGCNSLSATFQSDYTHWYSAILIRTVTQLAATI